VSEPTPGEVIGWVDVDALVASASWAANAEPDDLADALHAAYEECVLYGPLDNDRRRWTEPDPSEPVPPAVPARFVRAQALQARAHLRAATTGTENTQGFDGVTVTVFPMDWKVKNLLRPRKAVRRGPR
jgi:hypothetical protein